MAVPDQDPRNLHDLALDAQADIEHLATGLAHAGATPQAVAELSKMSAILKQIVKVLASGPGLEAAAQGAPAGPPGAVPAAPQHPGVALAPPQQQAAAPGAPPLPPPQPENLQHATQHLHQAMQNSAQQRQAPQPPPR